MKDRAVSVPSLSITVAVNHVSYTRQVRPNRLLVDLLHDELELIGTRNGCGQGICGCCTVLLDGEPVKSCLMLAAQADGCSVTTVEGLAADGQAHPLQAAFAETGAVQCGYCIPGMLMTAVALLDEHPAPSEDEIRAALANNVCRCTGYMKIIDAVKLAAAAGAGG